MKEIKDTICIVCGLKIEGSADQKTGRPKQFHKECRELNNTFDLLQNRLQTFRKLNPEKDKKVMVRKHLWSLANMMN